MANFLYDALNDFGAMEGGGEFPNVIDLGEASVERMAVDLKILEPLAPSPGMGAAVSAALEILGSNEEGGACAEIARGEDVPFERLNREGYSLPVPRNGYRFLKARLQGNFSGKTRALINPYIGK
jgi:hypothetical protein